MNIQRIAILAATGLVSSSAFAGTLWYNGDFDGRNGGQMGFGGETGTSALYDDFNVGAGGWNITSVFFNCLTLDSLSAFTDLNWEIRTGVTTGSGGTLVASGTDTNLTEVATGRSGFGYTEQTLTGLGLNVNLAAGTYFLGGWFDKAAGSGSTFISTTSGANAVGTPPGNDGNSYWNSPVTYGVTWVPTSSTLLFGAGTWDLSMGVNGSPAPEPVSMTFLGLGVVGLIARRRKQS